MGGRLTCGIRPRSAWNGPGVDAINFEDNLEATGLPVHNGVDAGHKKLSA
jgi:hypothetical protein